MHSRALRFKWASLGLVATVAIALPVRADDPPGAPPDQYAFFDQSSTVIRDNKTGLAWTRSVSANVVSFAVAQTTCAGKSRLPTLKELLTLVDEQPHLDYDESQGKTVTRMIDPQAFDASTPIDVPYWTSSMTPDGNVWTVDFSTGKTIAALKSADSRYVRCVTFIP
jgi:hypothetical protein